MTNLSNQEGPVRRDGLRAAARLLRAAGPQADMVFARLTPGETRAIHEQMNHLQTDHHDSDKAALEAFLLETAAASACSPPKDQTRVWSRLTRAEAPLLAALAGRESPQVAAWMMSQLDPQLAASVVRMLSDDVSLAILQRILKIKPPPQPVCELIEQTLEATLGRVGTASELDGHARVARIFDQLAPGEDNSLLQQLDETAPGSGERVRALMFTFEDLVSLDAAGMQTLIAAVPRAVLVQALKGAGSEVSNGFYSNLTRRAGALVREEIEGLGPLRRSEIEAARAEIVERARKLIQSGDISLGADGEDDELVE